MGPVSIVNLEQRTNAIKELEKLKEFIQTELFYQPLLYKPRENLTFLKFIKKHILELPFSKTANTFEQYCEEIGVNLNPQSEKEATKSILYITNFIMNTITAIVMQLPRTSTNNRKHCQLRQIRDKIYCLSFSDRTSFRIVQL